MNDLNNLSVNALLYSSILLALAPLLIGGATCYVKISLVVTSLRNALGSQQIPGNILVSSFSLCLSFMIMDPVVKETVSKWEQHLAAEQAVKAKPASKSEVSPGLQKGVENLSVPWRRFMLKHSGKTELEFICGLQRVQTKTETSKETAPNDCSVLGSLEGDKQVLAVPLQRALSAFLLSEVKSGFTMAFILLVPFFVVDMVVAVILTGLNMQMVSPLIVSFPLKLMLFVLTDAWQLLFEALFYSYQ
jgi:type III secretory pathway component EscR